MVTADAAEAAAELSRGGRVVLICAPGTPDPPPARPGRLAVLVGDPGDPAVIAAARAMHDELYWKA